MRTTKTTTSSAGRRITGTLLLALATASAGPAGAQEPDAPCPADRLEGWVGISGLTCSRCTIRSLSATERSWSFATEPEITRVDPESPAAGVLEAGDLLVGIDGHLITSREGGRRFGVVRPGDRVTLRYRRDGRLGSATLTAAGRCLAAELPDAPGIPPLPGVENAIDRIDGPRRSDVGAPPAPLPDEPGRPPLPELPEAAPPPPPPPHPGGGFRCSDCSTRTEEDRTVWRFSEPPEVVAVEPGGPAERAGLGPGDLILRVNGAPVGSREGGEAFGGLAPGETALLTVARPDGSTANVPLTPAEPQPPSAPTARSPRPGPPDVMRFTGDLGPARITVRGRPVTVLKDEGAGLLVIRTTDNEIRIRLAPVEGGGEP